MFDSINYFQIIIIVFILLLIFGIIYVLINKPSNSVSVQDLTNFRLDILNIIKQNKIDIDTSHKQFLNDFTIRSNDLSSKVALLYNLLLQLQKPSVPVDQSSTQAVTPTPSQTPTQ